MWQFTSIAVTRPFSVWQKKKVSRGHFLSGFVGKTIAKLRIIHNVTEGIVGGGGEGGK